MIEPTLLDVLLADTSMAGQLVAADLLDETGRETEALMLRLNVLGAFPAVGAILGRNQGCNIRFYPQWRQFSLVLYLLDDRTSRHYRLTIRGGWEVQCQEEGRLNYWEAGEPSLQSQQWGRELLEGALARTQK